MQKLVVLSLLAGVLAGCNYGSYGKNPGKTQDGNPELAISHHHQVVTQNAAATSSAVTEAAKTLK